MKLKIVFIMSIAILTAQYASAAGAGDAFQTRSGREVKIHCIKHGTLMIEYDHRYIYMVLLQFGASNLSVFLYSAAIRLYAGI